MHRRLLSLVTAALILTMILPPVCNTFDKWDKGHELPLSGHDAETTLMVMAFEMGLGIAAAWGSVLLLTWLAAVLLPGFLLTPAALVRCGIRATEYLLLLFSPPWRVIALRI